MNHALRFHFSDHRLPAAVVQAVVAWILIGASCFTAFGQSLTSLSGTVSDPTGALAPSVTVLIEDTSRGISRTVVSDEAGRYSFSQIPPGKYRLTAKAVGFADVVVEALELQVNTPATFNVVLRQLKEVTETVTVTAEATHADATTGNPFDSLQILQLPLEGRDVVGLLSLQTGVTYLGDNRVDARNGSVNGGRADQANVTLDGVDVNDQVTREAFTSVLRNTLDSVQEFRVTTIGANANQGRSSGAQIALVTKSGSNDFHGSVYSFHRNTATAANSFFNNQAGFPRPKLLRNVFGAAAGGPIKKNKLFFFFTYEGRRDASESAVVRTVPTLDYRQGIVKYLNTSGEVREVTPQQLKQLDPAGIGISQAALDTYQQYPAPNDPTSGDGLNTSGFRFLAKTPLTWNTYITRWDWNIDEKANHTVFFRGNLQNDRNPDVPQFPGQPANANYLRNGKGVAVGYNHILRPWLVGTFHYGLTRIAPEATGIQHTPLSNPAVIDPPFGQSVGATTIVPTHTFSEDLSWTRSAHLFQFGGVVRVIRRRSSNFAPFPFAYVDVFKLQNQAAALEPADLDPAYSSIYQNAAAGALGVLSDSQVTYNYDIAGNPLPLDQPVKRNFGNSEYEAYFQDTWRIKPNLTVIGGVRWSLLPPPYELNGQQTTMLPSYETLFARRLADAENGVSNINERISFVPRDSPQGGPLYPTYKKNFAPRLSVAWSPDFSNSLLSKLTGGPGKTTIRAGAGMFYELFGSGMIYALDQSAFGLRTTTRIPVGTFSLVNVPRFTSSTEVPTGLLPPPPPGGPGTPPDGLVTGLQVVDTAVKPPYVMNFNLGISRQLGKDWGLEVGYVGRFSRRQMINGTGATQPLNFRDPKSGMRLYDAMDILDLQSRANVPVDQVQPIPFFENVFSAAAAGGMTATQVAYTQFQYWPADAMTALAIIDSSCDPACSNLGLFTFFQPQLWGLRALQSQGTASYNSLQATLQKRFSAGVQFDLNYTFSKSIDLYSQTEVQQGFNAAGETAIVNALNPRAQRAVSDYDMTHQLNANWIAELPFGSGRRLLNRGGLSDAVFGGWQLSGLFRITSGLPYSVDNGFHWPTNWCCQGFATPIAPTPEQVNTRNSTIGGPNLFADPLAAAKTFEFSRPGQVGARNTLRGDGIFSLDLGLSKRFRLPFEGHSLQFRAEAFNVTNTARFGIYGTNNFLDNPRFGTYDDLLGSPRVIQFGLRYEF